MASRDGRILSRHSQEEIIMDHSELDEFLVDLVGPRIDLELTRELDVVRGRVRIYQEESSPPAVLVSERTR